MTRDTVITVLLIVAGVVLAFLLFGAGVVWRGKATATPVGMLIRDETSGPRRIYEFRVRRPPVGITGYLRTSMVEAMAITPTTTPRSEKPRHQFARGEMLLMTGLTKRVEPV